jgi:hypothetical protein
MVVAWSDCMRLIQAMATRPEMGHCLCIGSREVVMSGLLRAQRFSLQWVLLALPVGPLACADKSSEDPDDVDDIYDDAPGEGEGEGEGDQTCDGTWSVVEGLVTGPFSDDPAVGAQVYIWGDAYPDALVTETDSEGLYELELEPADNLVIEVYTRDGCWSSSERLVQTVDVHVDDCVVAEKPNLYLYPEQDTPTRVALDLDRRQQVVVSVPPYRPEGWSGIAHTDGTWTEHGRRVRDPFLFYEVSLAEWQAQDLQRTAGWCLPFGGEAAVFAMADILAAYGFDARERDDFVDAWIHDLPPAESYSVYPQLAVEPYAGLLIEPALAVDRLWLLVEDGAGCSPLLEPEVHTFDRTGAHGVEWGVVLGDLVR